MRFLQLFNLFSMLSNETYYTHLYGFFIWFTILTIFKYLISFSDKWNKRLLWPLIDSGVTILFMYFWYTLLALIVNLLKDSWLFLTSIPVSFFFYYYFLKIKKGIIMRKGIHVSEYYYLIEVLLLVLSLFWWISIWAWLYPPK